MLEAEGLVTLVANTGAWVARLSLAECEEMYQIRERIEPLLLRYNMPLLDDDELDRPRPARRRDGAGTRRRGVPRARPRVPPLLLRRAPRPSCSANGASGCGTAPSTTAARSPGCSLRGRPQRAPRAPPARLRHPAAGLRRGRARAARATSAAPASNSRATPKSSSNRMHNDRGAPCPSRPSTRPPARPRRGVRARTTPPRSRRRIAPGRRGVRARCAAPRYAQRAEWMNAAADLLEAEVEATAARMITVEMGKPIAQSRRRGAKCAKAMRFYAEHAEEFLADEPLADPSASAASQAWTRSTSRWASCWRSCRGTTRSGRSSGSPPRRSWPATPDCSSTRRTCRRPRCTSTRCSSAAASPPVRSAPC